MDRLNAQTQAVEYGTSLVSARSLPPVTTLLLILSYAATYLTDFGGRFPLWIGDLNTALLFLNPFPHLSMGHLVFNTVMILIAGILVERWMKLRRRNLLSIFIVCYLSSLATFYMKSRYVGPILGFGFGLSTMISATVPFLLFYCLFFCKEIQLKGRAIFAPFGVGLLFWWVIGPLFNWLFVTKTWSITELGDTPLMHLLAFGFALLPAFLLMYLIRRRTIR
jgi:membrane associated rhomboid family serine protease